MAVRSSAAKYYELTMNSLTVKIPPALEQKMIEASIGEQITKSELVRRALLAYVARNYGDKTKFISARDQAGDLVGCFSGGPTDLATNPKHMDGFGKV